MNRLRTLGYDALEDRKLLSTAHVSAHSRPAIVVTPLVLNGTLTADSKAATTTMDEEGDTTTMIPVAGQLGALGEVRGTWSETQDEYGDYMGPDTVRLHDSNGTFVVAFSEQNTKTFHHLAGGTLESVHPEHTSEGSGAYVHSKGSGTIALTTNAARTAIQTMTLSS
jgi:hypothetical protein